MAAVAAGNPAPSQERAFTRLLARIRSLEAQADRAARAVENLANFQVGAEDQPPPVFVEKAAQIQKDDLCEPAFEQGHNAVAKVETYLEEIVHHANRT